VSAVEAFSLPRLDEKTSQMRARLLRFSCSEEGHEVSTIGTKRVNRGTLKKWPDEP